MSFYLLQFHCSRWKSATQKTYFQSIHSFIVKVKAVLYSFFRLNNFLEAQQGGKSTLFNNKIHSHFPKPQILEYSHATWNTAWTIYENERIKRLDAI